MLYLNGYWSRWICRNIVRSVSTRFRNILLTLDTIYKRVTCARNFILIIKGKVRFIRLGELEQKQHLFSHAFLFLLFVLFVNMDAHTNPLVKGNNICWNDWDENNFCIIHARKGICEYTWYRIKCKIYKIWKVNEKWEVMKNRYERDASRETFKRLNHRIAILIFSQLPCIFRENNHQIFLNSILCRHNTAIFAVINTVTKGKKRRKI